MRGYEVRLLSGDAVPVSNAKSVTLSAYGDYEFFDNTDIRVFIIPRHNVLHIILIP
jgi:hypothetical protein